MSYCILATASVTDPSWTETYTQAVTALVESFGGQYTIRTPNIDVYEGNGTSLDVLVMMEFPSKDAFLAFYNSDAYQPYKEARQQGSTGFFYGVPKGDQAASEPSA